MHSKLLLFAAFILAFSGCKPENNTAGNQPLKNTQIAAGTMKAIV
jgi:hypothetical protein